MTPEKDILFEGSFRLSSQREAITSVLDKVRTKYSVLFVEVQDDTIIKRRLEERLKTGHAGNFQHYLDIKKIRNLIIPT
jgi:hypothetical protein